MTAQRTPGGAKAKNQLLIYNALTKKKEPLQSEGAVVKWYTCGPTVYDSAHLGHARTYVVLDTMRKCLERYFNYEVTYIMNITDIDDKIIIKARESMKNAQKHPLTHINPFSDSWAEEMHLNVEEQKKIHKAVYEVSRKYEKEFFNDMAELGVDLPTYTTRISAYVEETVRYIEEIERRGYAYESEGSVYFDVKKYKEKHKYPLMCSEHNQQELLEEGEGKLSRGEKKSREDFALWKASKEEEPAWKSKWGAGRPGWHIECSAMASNVAGGRIDIHSGGIDLIFPHHDNEIAQAEGYGIEDWVGHFIHTGHLHIDGRKMSKSLKNFIKVDELLKKGTARELRVMFLLQSYRGAMTYGEESLERAKTIEKKIFRYISLFSGATEETSISPLGEKELSMLEEFNKYVEEVDSAIKDDFNYPKVFSLIVELIGKAGSIENKQINRQIAKYIKKVMHALGLEIKEAVEENKLQEQLVSCVSLFRNKIRTLTKESADKSKYFNACDDVRKELTEMGIIIEDSINPQTAPSVRRKQ